MDEIKRIEDLSIELQIELLDIANGEIDHCTSVDNYRALMHQYNLIDEDDTHVFLNERGSVLVTDWNNRKRFAAAKLENFPILVELRPTDSAFDHEGYEENRKLKADLTSAQERIAALEAENERLIKALENAEQRLIHAGKAYEITKQNAIDVYKVVRKIIREALQPAREVK